MKLNDYLKETGQTGKSFAKKAGIHPSVISRAIRGVRNPGYASMLAIAKASRDMVTPNDFAENRGRHG